MDDCIKKYIENTTMCRRDLLFSDFDGYSHSDIILKSVVVVIYVQ